MIIDRKAVALLVLLAFLVLPAHRVPADKPTEPNSSEFPVFATKSPLRSLAVTPVNRGAAPALSFSPREAFEPNGTMAIFLESQAVWDEVEEVEFDKHLRTREVTLPEGTAGQTVRLRISRAGGGASHLDSLTVGGSTAVGLDERLTRKLGARDNDVVDTSEIEGQTLEFRLPEGPAPTLELAGRIEAERISETPFLFPTENLYTEISTESAFYEYRIGSSPGRLTVDGALGAEALSEPFFSENPTVGSGHPQAATTGWVMDDGEYLYVAIDFAADNTMDGGKDYTAVHINTPAGPQVYRASTRETQWGTPGFEYTDTVAWEHKVYEYAIPMGELGLDRDDAEGQAVELAFEAYGTAASLTLDSDSNGVYPDFGPSGTTFTFLVTYQNSPGAPPNVAEVWIDLDGDGDIDSARPPIGFLSPRGPWSILLVASLFFGAIAFWIVSPIPVRRPVFSVFAIVALFGLLIACSSSGNTSPEETTQEVYGMSRTADGEFFASEEYTVSVTIHKDPGDYEFQFRFETSGGSQLNLKTDDNSDPLTLTIEIE